MPAIFLSLLLDVFLVVFFFFSKVDMEYEIYTCIFAPRLEKISPAVPETSVSRHNGDQLRPVLSPLNTMVL